MIKIIDSECTILFALYMYKKNVRNEENEYQINVFKSLNIHVITQLLFLCNGFILKIRSVQYLVDLNTC